MKPPSPPREAVIRRRALPLALAMPRAVSVPRIHGADRCSHAVRIGTAIDAAGGPLMSDSCLVAGRRRLDY